EGGEAPGDGVRPRGEALVREGLPGGEGRDPIRIDEALQRRRKLVGLPPRGGDDDEGPVAFVREAGEDRDPRPCRDGDVAFAALAGGSREPRDLGIAAENIKQRG